MRNHVTRHLPAYVHRQLSPKQRQQVARHIARCADCRAALERERQLANDLTVFMPRVGQPEPGQLRRLWPSILAEVRNSPPRAALRIMPSAGVLIAMLLIAAFSLSALFGDATHVNAAPNPHVPADVRATNTPVRTDEPGGEVDSPPPSQTASALLLLPNPSPVPPPLDAGTAGTR